MAADKTAIEWTRSDDGTPGASWNPVVGCSIVSPGCKNCYAMKQAHDLERRFNSPKYRGLTKVVNGNPVWTGEVRLSETALLQPFRWKRPRRIFVNSMSDLFHEALSDAAIDKVFAVMALCWQHSFQVLTKRGERMRTYMENVEREALWMNAVADLFEIEQYLLSGRYPVMGRRDSWLPLPNVHLGVSCERQQEADERIPHLLQTPATVRFVSAEPLIGPIYLQQWLSPARGCANCGDGQQDGKCCDEPLIVDRNALDWVIVGGESGHGARPMSINWVESIVAQCETAGVAAFVKQLGARPYSDDGGPINLEHSKGGNPDEWPAHLRVREFPE